MQISEVVEGRVKTILATEPVLRALQIMLDEGIRHLPVRRGRQAVGMVSDHNILNHIGWHQDDRHRQAAMQDRVEKIMRTPIVTSPPDVPIEEVAKLMLRRNIGAMPLQQDERLTGIATKSDILKCFVHMAACVGTEVPHRSIESVMSREVLSVAPSDATLDARHTMQAKQIQHLPVVENGQVVGMLSDRDILRGAPREQVQNVRFGRHSPLASPLHVRGIMSPHVVMTAPKATIRETAHTMITHKIGALPVSEEGALVGIITETDLLRVLVKTCEAEASAAS